MSSEHPRRLGDWGEEAAGAELERLGYRILSRRFRRAGGEADFVAEEGGDLVFIEVKTRRRLLHGLPGDAVNWRKRQRLVVAAEAYCAALPDEPPPCRFDIVEVVAMGGGEPEIRLLRDAFRPGD